MSSSRAAVAALAAALFSAPGIAGERLESLQVSGFVSQGLVYTNENNLYGSSTSGGGSTQLTELGVNASVRPTPQLLLSAQVLSRRAGSDGRAARPALDHGVADYQRSLATGGTAGVQLGRFKNPFGLYNQTRDVPFTRPGILLPQSIYFDRTRSVALAADGASVYWDERVGRGDLRLQIGAGRPQTGEDLAATLRLDDQPGSLNARDSIIGQLRYEHDGGRIVAALSAARVRIDFDGGSGGPGDGKTDFRPVILSLQYNSEDWSLTGEYALRPFEVSGFDQAPRNFDVTGESGYVQYERRLGPAWSAFVRYDVLYTDRSDRSGRDFEGAGQGPAHSRFAKDLTLGVRWRVHPQVLLAGEVHRVDGTGWLPLADNEPGEIDRRWDLFLLQASLRF
ncbi:hypothetical protein J2T57_001240 [Natronocella acetinitrilica]|uniref:Porin n=1 Tax=Natronocella acetinitrilica TaxID=414046 RepID=A0AAE3G2U5_9GAMM|nr:hypothetical protein [Natronocella acetinitrilica]MCP1674138.1 hypothetical protein [Natronocella acetinitrilica]